MRRVVVGVPWICAMAALWTVSSGEALLAAPVPQAASPVYVVTTLAGKSPVTAGAIDDTGTFARFNRPTGLAFAANGDLLIADRFNHTIRRMTPAGVVSTVAGLAGTAGHVDGTSTGARFSNPTHVAVGGTGRIFVLDAGNNAIRVIETTGTVSTLAGGNLSSGSTNGTGAAATFSELAGIVVDLSDNVYVSEGGPDYCYPELRGQMIRKITPAGVVTTLAGGACVKGSTDAVGTAARFNQPAGLAVDSQGRVYVADAGNHTIRRITSDGTVTTVAGVAGTSGSADGALGTGLLSFPFAISVAASGRVFALQGRDTNTTIRELTTTGLATIATVSPARGFAVDTSDQWWVTQADAVARLTPNLTLTTIAGAQTDPTAGQGYVDSTGDAARFNYPWGVTPDDSGGVFIADAMNLVIRHITSTGVVTTVAGAVGSVGSTDGSSSDARFHLPHGLGGDRNGTIIIGDSANQRVRRRNAAGAVSTLPGSFDGPDDVAQDSSGNIYVSNFNVHAVYRITTGGQVELFAGQPGNAGTTDGPVATATLVQPRQIDVAPDGTVYVLAGGLRRIRNGQVDTVASNVYGMAVTASGVLFYLTRTGVTRVATDGQATTYSALDARGHSYTMPSAFDMAVVSGERLIFTDQWNHTVIQASLQSAPAITTQPSSQAVTAGQPATFTVAASGSPTPTYQWQTSSDGGTTWTDLSNTSPYSGVTTSTLALSATSVSSPLRRFRAVVTNSLGTATSDAATLTVPGLLVQPSSLWFRVLKSGAAGPVVEHPTQELLATFVATTPGAITWSADQSWVRLAPSLSGPAAGVWISDPSNVLADSTSASAVITVSAPGVSPVQIPLSLEIVQDYRLTAAPIGQVDTPIQGATGAQGAIAFSGWATDDIGVFGVLIYRNCVPDEPQVNCQVGVIPGRGNDRVVRLGTAQLVPGARPDIEAAFPTYPGNRAGWGFLILTNMLPRTTGTFSPYGGQGPITLYAVAMDGEGNYTLLGRDWANDATPTTITLDNDAIAKPFGTIDTPAQGERITSDVFNNYGWVLTPDTDTVSGNGDIEMSNTSGLTLFIDGLPIAVVAYNQCRGNVGNPVPAGVFCNDDISNIFGAATVQASLTMRTSNPTRFRNLDAGRGAIGATQISTAGLSNGLHTIAWSATDSAGRVEGIGSRYFSVLRPQVR